MSRRARDEAAEAASDETPLLTETQVAAELAAAEAQTSIGIEPPQVGELDLRIGNPLDRDRYMVVNGGGHLVSIPYSTPLPPGFRLATTDDMAPRGA